MNIYDLDEIMSYINFDTQLIVARINRIAVFEYRYSNSIDMKYIANDDFLIGYYNISRYLSSEYEYQSRNYNKIMYGACFGGNFEIAKQMILTGATCLNSGLYYACLGGYLELINLMIENGATDWNYGLLAACHTGYLDIVEMMINRGANIWNGGLKNACKQKHSVIVYLMIKNGATECSHCFMTMEAHLLQKK